MGHKLWWRFQFRHMNWTACEESDSTTIRLCSLFHASSSPCWIAWISVAKAKPSATFPEKPNSQSPVFYLPIPPIAALPGVPLVDPSTLILISPLSGCIQLEEVPVVF